MENKLKTIIFLVILLNNASLSTSNLEYKITKTWDNQTVPGVEILIKLRASGEDTTNKGLIMSVEAPYYASPAAPNTIPGQTYGLWEYEVVEIFFLGPNDKYLEVEISPTCHYIAISLEGQRNILDNNLFLPNTRCTINSQGEASTWTSDILIPEIYFPPQVNRFNAYAIHWTKPDRQYMALFPVPFNSSEHNQPDFHKLEFFQEIDLANLIDILRNSAISLKVGCIGILAFHLILFFYSI